MKSYEFEKVPVKTKKAEKHKNLFISFQKILWCLKAWFRLNSRDFTFVRFMLDSFVRFDACKIFM